MCGSYSFDNLVPFHIGSLSHSYKENTLTCTKSEPENRAALRPKREPESRVGEAENRGIGETKTFSPVLPSLGLPVPLPVPVEYDYAGVFSKQRGELLTDHFEEVSPKIDGSALPHLLAWHGFDFGLHCREKLADHHLGGAIDHALPYARQWPANLYVPGILQQRLAVLFFQIQSAHAFDESSLTFAVQQHFVMCRRLHFIQLHFAVIDTFTAAGPY